MSSQRPDPGAPAWARLVLLAHTARARAYAPHSGFKVGAALEAADGAVTTGCNVENAVYPATICAERAAVLAAVGRGRRAFRRVVVATAAERPTTPCGMCLQVLAEFDPAGDLEILCVTTGGAADHWHLRDLLPRPPFADGPPADAREPARASAS